MFFLFCCAEQGASAAGTWVCGVALLYDSFPADEIGGKMGLVSLIYGTGARA